MRPGACAARTPCPQLPHEVQLDLPLPFWVDPAEDLQVS